MTGTRTLIGPHSLTARAAARKSLIKKMTSLDRKLKMIEN